MVKILCWNYFSYHLISLLYYSYTMIYSFNFLFYIIMFKYFNLDLLYFECYYLSLDWGSCIWLFICPFNFWWSVGYIFILIIPFFHLNHMSVIIDSYNFNMAQQNPDKHVEIFNLGLFSMNFYLYLCYLLKNQDFYHNNNYWSPL